MNNLYFRVDGNPTIGTGHIMRCLSIAEEAIERHLNPIFILADNTYLEYLTEKKIDTIVLNSKWNDLDNEISEITNIIKKFEIRKIFFDSYQVTKKYISALKKLVKVIYIDDLNLFFLDTDYLINYNIYADNEDYSKYSEKQLMLGTKYVPLRKEFQTYRKFKVSPLLQNIFITTGGTDQLNFLNYFIDRFIKVDEYKNIKLHVVSGTLNDNFKELKIKEKTHENIIIYSNVDNMRELIESCDIAISAGGVTLYELCFCGIPTILFSIADNQLKAVNSFSRKKIMHYTGDFRENKDNVIFNLFKNIDLLKEEKTRESLSRKMQSIVDGGGVKRILSKLIDKV